ncbi:MAG TPA: hypothetical protein VES79_13385 [Solirubrobacteraceae bacterium]|nr:hypothetical protein [Solirubrobacteraceae bacterium]
MKKILPGLMAGFALAAAPAAATPVTVDLRIEGPSRTLFEAPVTTDVRTFKFSDDATDHRCDGTAAENQGPSTVPVPTRGAAVAEAAERTPFNIRGQWFGSLGSPSFSEIAGESVEFDPATNRFLVEYNNAQAASVGSCGDPIQAGDDVLFAYGDGTEQLLALTGPGSARPGETATVKVADAGNGSAVGGAAVDGRVTGADGAAVVGPFTQRGNQDLKATKSGTIRSNRLRVCVSDGQDGFCGTTAPGSTGTTGTPGSGRDSTPPTTLLALRDGATFSSRRAPRLLRGSVSPDPSGLRTVKLRLARRVGGRCSYFSGRRERLVGTRCGRAFWFAIGDRVDWSYLLPARLPAGSYVLEAKAIDAAFNRGAPARVRFRVK